MSCHRPTVQEQEAPNPEIFTLHVCPAVYPRGRRGVLAWDNLFSATKINPSGGGGGEKRGLTTAGSTYQRSRVKSVWCTFRFLLQQRRSVSVSEGLNEGLVSRATGSRSTRPRVCVFTINPALCLQQATSSTPLPPSLLPHAQMATFTGASPNTLFLPPTTPHSLSVHKSCMHTHTHTLHTLHLLTVDNGFTRTHAHVQYMPACKHRQRWHLDLTFLFCASVIMYRKGKKTNHL